MKKFDWTVTDSAPKGYPMKIVSGWLYYVGEKDNGIYVPDRRTLVEGWGISESLHVVGPDLKPVPDRLSITFFSYAEDQFYQGTFNLPHERIAELFAKGYFNAQDNEHMTYTRVMVGVAPGGSVAVWLSGVGRITEVFFGKAEKADIDWRRVNDNPDITRKQYVEKRLAFTLGSEGVESLRKNGIPFDRWDRYRARYHWTPVFKMPRLPNAIRHITFVNGEKDTFIYPLTKDRAEETRAVPREMIFPWTTAEGAKYSIELYFDEAEIVEAFERLGNQRPLELEITIDEPRKKIFVWVRNDKEAIELKKLNAKRYGSS